MTVLVILAVLFIALIVIVPLLERSKTRISDESVAKMSRWVLPLLLVLALVQFFMYMF